MDARLIAAEEKHRARGGSILSPDFRRLLRLVWPHRRFVVVGLIASVVYGLLHSVSILGVLPILKTMLADEGFHGWAHLSVAEQRLEVKFDRDLGAGVESLEISSGLPIRKLAKDSPLAEAGFRPGERIVAVDGRAGGPLGLAATIAEANAPVELSIEAGAVDAPSARQVRIALRERDLQSRLLLTAVDLLPEVRERDDRIAVMAYVLGAVACCVVLANISRFVAQYFTALGVLRGVMDLRRGLYGKVLRLPMDFFSTNVSDIVSRFVQDAQEIQMGLMSLFGKLLREPIRAAFLLAVALLLDARMTLTMLVVAPAALAVFWVVGRKIRKANNRLLQIYGMMIGALTTKLAAIGIVKAYNSEHVERRNLWRIDRQMFRRQMKLVRLEASLPPTLEVLGVIGICAVTAWLGSLLIDGELEFEKLVVLVAALGMLVDPLRRMADVYPRIMRCAAAARRIYAVVDTPGELEVTAAARMLEPLKTGIELRNVTYSYPNAPAPAVKGVSLRVEKGETVAIVGANGSGKTTLTRLLLRFGDPQAGEILIDGMDIREVNLRSLRRQFSLVSQDPVVFAMTIAENIAYGSRGASPEAIADAARRAHADQFILEKGEGYDELVGERGSTLSGGQRQRLCIARAILRDAPILIFDEATSQIDSESERDIQHSLAELVKDRTTFIIAHRLSTIRFARRIIVMERGQVIDTGSHEELAERCPLYIALCQTQFSE